jgi:putative ABC transport system ATP-binding protein
MLELKSLIKRLASPPELPLFENLSLCVQPGECVAIVGESGAGKSTLLNCIAGLERPDDGSMMLDGTDLLGLDDDAFARLRRRQYGFVFQAFHILPHLTVAQNVALPLWLLETDELVAEARAGEMLARVGLASRAGAWPRHLSGGELQRVAIARAVVHNPRLVLADEPTGNLDPERAGAVIDLLLDCIRGAGAMGVLVTHSAIAAARADRILRLTPHGLVPGEVVV